MAAQIWGWYQVVIHMRLAVMWIKAERVNILVYLSEFRLITSYTTPDSVANRDQAVPIVQLASGIIK